jgi:hypothetical protein
MVAEHGMDKPQAYQIRVQGQVDQSWSDWFDGMNMQIEIDDHGTAFTTLSGIVQDQAALRGILAKLWNLNLGVVSVQQSDWLDDGEK